MLLHNNADTALNTLAKNIYRGKLPKKNIFLSTIKNNIYKRLAATFLYGLSIIGMTTVRNQWNNKYINTFYAFYILTLGLQYTNILKH